ncbi:MAG: Holliday junction resolvase RuvX [Acidimicrobiales bacterium]
MRRWQGCRPGDGRRQGPRRGRSGPRSGPASGGNRHLSEGDDPVPTRDPADADAVPGSDVHSGRVLGLDLGQRRIGVAVCDAGRTVATPYGTVHRVGDRPAEHRSILDIVAETEVGLVVFGLPLSLDGSVGPAAKAVLSEVRALRRSLSMAVETHDERLTTVTAEDYLAERGIRGGKRREVVDQVAAAIILQSWIDAGRHSTERTE